MGLRDRFGSIFGGWGRAVPTVQGEVLADLPLHSGTDIIDGDQVAEALLARRDQATSLATTNRAGQLEARNAEARANEAIGIGSIGPGLGLDSDDYSYRRLTGQPGQQRRDLTPLQQDRMLEIVWYLWEQNAFAKRLITLMSDLILGDGVSVEAVDERVQDAINLAWNHRVNQLKTRISEFHNALSVNGELILTAATNPINGTPTLGFIDPYQVKSVDPLPDNVLVLDTITLKAGAGEQSKTLKIIRENPDTGMLEGEVFYLGINKMPNSMRGRSDLSTLADWLDLYDTYLFAEVERLQLLSAFVWDYKIDGAQKPEIDQKLRAFPKPTPGRVWAHNEKETLEARTPDLKAADRSEAGRMLRVHIAGAFGFPLSYLGEIDSNKATIDGQNDVLLKTPAARQKTFAVLLDQIVRFTIEQSMGKNPALFQDVKPHYRIRMPEIASKDIARVGQVLISVVSAMDTAMANKTASRKLACAVLVGMLKHLGIEADPQEVMDQADLDAEEKQAMADEMQAQMAAAGMVPGGNPPVPNDPTPPPAPAKPVAEAVDVPAPPSQVMHVHLPATSVAVSPADVTVNVPAAHVKRTTTVERDGNNLITKTETVETPVGG